MVQKTITFLEYEDLFNKANTCEDENLRCGYILAAFFLIYSHTIGTVKKPFNSFLGETYEFIDQKTNLTLISE